MKKWHSYVFMRLCICFGQQVRVVLSHWRNYIWRNTGGSDSTEPVRIDLLLSLMQINKLLCIIHKFVKVVYEKAAQEETIFVSENLWINIKADLFAWAIFHKLKNNPIQTGTKRESSLGFSGYKPYVSCEGFKAAMTQKSESFWYSLELRQIWWRNRFRKQQWAGRRDSRDSGGYLRLKCKAGLRGDCIFIFFGKLSIWPKDLLIQGVQSHRPLVGGGI